MALIVLYFLHRTSVFSFYIDVVLTLSIRYDKYLMAAMAPNRRWAFAKILMLIVNKCRWRCLLKLYVVYETVLYLYDKCLVFYMLCMYSYQIYAHYSLSISHIYIAKTDYIFCSIYIYMALYPLTHISLIFQTHTTSQALAWCPHTISHYFKNNTDQVIWNYMTSPGAIEVNVIYKPLSHHNSKTNSEALSISTLNDIHTQPIHTD